MILISGLAYLVLAGQLGYYHDDWFTTVSRISGIPLTIMHSVDRPGMGTLYQVVANFLGESPQAWHWFAWAAKTLGGLALLWLLRLLWPEQKMATFLMAVLYVVYPGFLQQTSANNYQNHLAAYSASILSLALTVRAVQSRRKAEQVLMIILAVLLAYGYPRVYEAMIGMEGLRFFLIWYAAKDEQKLPLGTRFLGTLVWFTPFLANALYFVYWRMFKFISLRTSVDAGSLLDKYRGNFAGSMAQIAVEWVKDAFETIFAAWVVPLYQLGLEIRYRYFLIGLIFVAVAFLAIYAYRMVLKEIGKDVDSSGYSWAVDAMVIGGLGVLVTLLPVELSDRNVQFRNFLDRYTYQSIVPTVMFLVGLVYLSVKSGWRYLFISGFVAAAIFTHLFNASNYAANWEAQRQVWWQLSWRVPQLQPGTALLVQMPNRFRYPEGFEVWAPANRIYYPDRVGPVITSEVINKDTLVYLQTGSTEERNFRMVEFEIDFSKSLILSIPSEQSCLHVLDQNKLEFSPWDDDLTRQAAAASHPEQIQLEADFHVPPGIIFGQEPAHNWCYYYQKAALARQRGDWPGVVRLAEEANQQGFEPADPVEWLPFFEGYLYFHRLEDARRIADDILEMPDIAQKYCKDYSNAAFEIRKMAQSLLCAIP